jgi:hypothetical protein
MKQRQASQIGFWKGPSQLAVLGNLRTLIPDHFGIAENESIRFSMFLFVA